MTNMSRAQTRHLDPSPIPKHCWVPDSDWSRWPSEHSACSPGEWPYNLEAPIGTREFCRIVDWFLSKHPRVYEPDIGDCLTLAKQCAPGKTITAQVSRDPETGDYELCFTIYGCTKSKGLSAKEMDLYWAREAKRPELMALHHHVWVTYSCTAFPGLTRRQ